MMNAYKASLLVSLLLSFSTYANSNTTENSKELADPVMSATASSEPAASKQEVVAAQTQGPEDAYSYVEQKAQTFVDTKRSKFAQQNKQVFMHSGAAIVSLKSTEAGWSDARIMAYQEAQQKARENLLKQLYVDVAAKTIRSSFKSNKLPEFQPEEIQAQGKLEALLDKIVALADATLNSELSEAGIDPNEYDAAPASKRKVMMRKAITKSVRTAARGDISGSQIMKTYEKTDKNGNTAVAVVIATSNKKKNFLTSLRLSKGNIKPELSKAKMSVQNYLAKHKSNLMYQMGTKVLWDENGYPVLLSFGMSGNDCNPADYEECVDNREFSFIDAELDAFAHLSEAYNLSGSVTAESSTTQDKSRTAEITLASKQVSEPIETTIAKIIKETKQSSSMTSSVKGLVGIQQATRWTEKHPITNREVNGIVLMWHPLSEQATRNFKANKQLKKNSANAAKLVIKAGTGESDEADDEDF
jgi:hypothetical protein